MRIKFSYKRASEIELLWGRSSNFHIAWKRNFIYYLLLIFSICTLCAHHHQRSSEHNTNLIRMNMKSTTKMLIEDTYRDVSLNVCTTHIICVSIRAYMINLEREISLCCVVVDNESNFTCNHLDRDANTNHLCFTNRVQLFIFLGTFKKK